MRKEKNTNLVYGCFWLFVTGSLLGVVIEGVFCLIDKGHWETHTALVFGPFVVVYGIGAVAVYLLATILHKRNIFIQFGAYFLAGALVEYFSSLIQQVVFGSVSWNYSQHFLNIGGRVSLKMTLGWGVLGVLFVKFIYTLFKKMFFRKVKKSFTALTVVVAVFMVCNIGISVAAVLRWHQRVQQLPATNVVAEVLDEHFDNEKMEKIYQRLQFVN